MQTMNSTLTFKLQELVDLQAEVELQEKKYALLLKADEPLEIDCSCVYRGFFMLPWLIIKKQLVS